MTSKRKSLTSCAVNLLLFMTGAIGNRVHGSAQVLARRSGQCMHAIVYQAQFMKLNLMGALANLADSCPQKWEYTVEEFTKHQQKLFTLFRIQT